MATKTKSGRGARANALVTTASVLGILVLVNVLGVWAFGRADLTENRRYTLSEVSRQAAASLDGVDVQVFVSKDLPPTLGAGQGMERDIRGVDRELLDKLAEYQSYSNGNLRVTVVQDEIEDRAQKAKLELFTGKQAAIEGGRLEFKKYALGATFTYRDQMEVFPLAIEPEFFEFEITKILLRLKEKHEKSQSMQAVLDAGAAVGAAVKACNEKLDGYRKNAGGAAGGAGALGALVGGGNPVAALRTDRVEFKKTCDQVAAAVAKLEPLQGKNENLDPLIGSGGAYADGVDELSRLLDDPKGEQNAAVGLERLIQVGQVVDRDADNLKNSPGRKAIGFLCGHREFCPFADPKPLVNPQLAQMMAGRNPIVTQFLQQQKQVEEQVNLVNEQLRRGLFTRKGLTLKRIDAGQDIPEDVEVLVVYAPQKPLSDRDRYNIDQFLLSGRSVIVFAANWDVAVYNFKKGGEWIDPNEMTVDELSRTAYPTNVDELLRPYGVQVNRDLVIEPRSFEAITILQLQKQGQYTIQSQREFPYPLLPTFTELDREHVLVRRLAGLTLPFASSLTVTDAARNNPALEVNELVRSSEDAIATTENLELSPPYLVRQLPTLKPNGPVTAAAVLKGEFQSAFAGKPVPPRDAQSPDDPEGGAKPKPVDRPFQEKGRGRLLVIASNLGLENLSTERVFDGFNVAALTSGGAEYFLKLRDYIANFQNWQLRLTQIAPTVQANLDFLYNVLDWGVQNEALVDIRSKGYVKRPIRQLSSGGQTAVRLGMILGLPLAFALVGVLRFAARRKGK